MGIFFFKFLKIALDTFKTFERMLTGLTLSLSKYIFGLAVLEKLKWNHLKQLKYNMKSSHLKSNAHNANLKFPSF